MDWPKFKRRAKFWYIRILRLQGTPDQIAGGIALGTFLGFVLPPGTQTVVALGTAPILRCNPIAAAAAVWVTNPLTMPIIYPAALALGSFISGTPVRQTIPVDEERFWAFLFNFQRHSRLIINMTTGLMIMGATSSLITFYVTKLLLLWHRGRKKVTPPAP